MRDALNVFQPKKSHGCRVSLPWMPQRFRDFLEISLAKDRSLDCPAELAHLIHNHTPLRDILPTGHLVTCVRKFRKAGERFVSLSQELACGCVGCHSPFACSSVELHSVESALLSFRCRNIFHSSSVSCGRDRRPEDRRGRDRPERGGSAGIRKFASAGRPTQQRPALDGAADHGCAGHRLRAREMVGGGGAGGRAEHRPGAVA